ncbi:MAG: trypco2 family protein [Cyanobacteria bacterium P01_C01_bin.118]
MSSAPEPQRIGLQEAISALRTELIASVVASQGERLLFAVGEITMEFQIEVERNIEANGGLKFYVVELGAKGTEKAKDVHKVVIPLRPIRVDGKPVVTGSDDDVPE